MKVGEEYSQNLKKEDTDLHILGTCNFSNNLDTVIKVTIQRTSLSLKIGRISVKINLNVN